MSAPGRLSHGQTARAWIVPLACVPLAVGGCGGAAGERAAVTTSGGARRSSL